MRPVFVVAGSQLSHYDISIFVGTPRSSEARNLCRPALKLICSLIVQHKNYGSISFWQLCARGRKLVRDTVNLKLACTRDIFSPGFHLKWNDTDLGATKCWLESTTNANFTRFYGLSPSCCNFSSSLNSFNCCSISFIIYDYQYLITVYNWPDKDCYNLWDWKSIK